MARLILDSDSISQASDNSIQQTECLTLDTICPAIRESHQWRILVYGVHHFSYTQKQNDHHLRLLSGILGEQVSAGKQTLSSFKSSKNGVNVTIYIGSNAECRVTSEDVDLLLYFIPMDRDAIDKSCAETINQITDTRGAMIWKHSLAILTGVDVAVNQMKNNVSVRLETLLNTLTAQIQQALASVIGDEENISKTDVLIRPAGRQDQPNLPKPHEKWFSQFFLGCFVSSKVKSMPAILKLAQNRIANNVPNVEILELDFYQQKIQAKENSVDLPQNLKIGLGIGGSTAIAGAAAVGATTGALIGALAIGIPSFGVAAGTGLALGAVIGGGLGASIAGAAVGGKWQAARNKQLEEISVSELKLYYAELLTRLPKLCMYLKKWAESQVSCRIVVTGVKEEGVSTVAAALIGQEPQESRKGFYWQQIIPMKANLVVHDFQGSPKVANKQDEAKELVAFQKTKDTNLLIFCIPMTSSKEDLVYSPHVKYLERLCEIVNDILSNTVIALTHANQMRAEMRRRNDLSQTSFQQFFRSELEGWKSEIRTVFKRYIHIDDDIAEKVPIIPVGNVEPSFDLSDNEQPSAATQYHWLSELLLHAMPATKPEGLPTLIKTNRNRIEKRPNEYRDLDRARELIIEAQCSMFSQVGLREKKQPGEAAGLILGVRETQSW